MKVKELIEELKKQPQNCTVGVSMHDNSENEVAGLATGVTFVKKEDIPKTDVRFDDAFPKQTLKAIFNAKNNNNR